MERGEGLTFALVEWLGENLFSVVPTVCSKDPAKCKPGVTMDFKWGNSRTKMIYYKTLILKISSELFVYCVCVPRRVYYRDCLMATGLICIIYVCA